MIGFSSVALALLLTVLAAAGGTGQFLTAVWQTSEGMPHNSATALLQDRRGYLWVATNSGVARFDGVRFETFKVADGLPDNRVLCLMEDRQGRIWVGTSGGVAVRERGQWKVKAAPWPTDEIWEIAQASDGAIWLGGNSHAYRCRGERVERIEVADSGVRYLLPAGDRGEMWILYREGLFRWEAGIAVPDAALGRVSAGREMWRMARDGEGALWVAGEGVLARSCPEARIWTDMSGGMPDAEGTHIRLLPARDGSLWVATRNRGLRFLRKGQWRVFGMDEGLSHEDARDICEDREGNLWVGTNGGGLNRMHEQQIEVFGRSRGLGRQVTTALACDSEGRILAGTDGGGVMRLRGQRFETALPEGVLENGYVWSITTGGDGALWVGTFRNGVLCWKDGKAEWLNIGNGLLHNWVPSLMVASDGVLWIGTQYGGVQTWDGKSLRTLRGSRSQSGAAITGFLETTDGDVWVATAGYGLMRWRKGEMRRFTGRDGLLASVITALHQDDAGTLWVGTGGGGLAAWRPDRDDFRSWTSRDGLHSDSIQQVQSDVRGILWIGSDDGLQRVSAADLRSARKDVSARMKSRVFSRSEGLPTPQFSGLHGNLSLRAPDGSLWFALTAGAVRVPPGAGEGRPHGRPSIHIEELRAGDRLLWHFERTPAGVVRLSPELRDLTIRFTATRLGPPGDVRFRHRLIGLDREWRSGSGERMVAYPSLPPGKYRFELCASGRDGQWQQAAVPLEFELRPHFWETAFVRFLAVLVAVVLLALLVRNLSLRRVRRRMRLLEQERRLDKERSRIARDLHDDLGATLTEINFLGSLGVAGAQTPATRERLVGIVERAQRMAKSLDEIVWTVNPANDTLASTVSYLCSRTRESFGVAGISCRLEVDDSFPAVSLDSERRHHLLMAVNEAVNNVMKHSGTASARLRVGSRAGQLEVAIEDDGLGFDPAAVTPGRNGLENMRRRMAAAHGSLIIDSSPGAGTRIRLSLPLAGSA